MLFDPRVGYKGAVELSENMINLWTKTKSNESRVGEYDFSCKFAEAALRIK